MNSVAAFGRILFALALIGFGIEHILQRGIVIGVELAPPWPPSHMVWGYITAAILILGGLCLAFRWIPAVACIVLAALFFNAVVLLDLHRVLADWKELTNRTRFLETLCLGGAALIFIGLLTRGTRASGLWRTAQILALIGTWLFALSMIVFGIDHMLVPAFIASLIPKWIPFPLYWAWGTALAMVAAGVAFLTRIGGRAAAILLGLMFLGWVIVLHAPRIYAALHNGAEWNSGILCLAMSGIAFALSNSTAIRKGF